MKRLRSLAVLFLGVYLFFAIGVQFHSDYHQGQAHPHCNLCQAAHISFLQTPDWHGSVEQKILGTVQLLTSNLPDIAPQAPATGRDPPTV